MLRESLTFINSTEFMNSGLKNLLKNLPEDKFSHLSQEFFGKHVKLVKQIEIYPYEYMNSLKKFMKQNYQIKRLL